MTRQVALPGASLLMNTYAGWTSTLSAPVAHKNIGNEWCTVVTGQDLSDLLPARYSNSYMHKYCTLHMLYQLINLWNTFQKAYKVINLMLILIKMLPLPFRSWHMWGIVAKFLHTIVFLLGMGSMVVVSGSGALVTTVSSVVVAGSMVERTANIAIKQIIHIAI